MTARLPRRRLLATRSDDRLVELVIDGDEMAFELLYQRHVGDALAFANGLLGSHEEAKQAVRHAFAAAHAYLADGGRNTAFEPWLYTILDNHCLSVLQRRSGVPGAPEVELATVVDLDDWRRRRKLLGGALPLAPGAGFHDSVMAACGIGGGAAAASAPLLGGAVAKLAVVVILAGGAGVAGDVADRSRPAEADVAVAPSTPAVDPSAASPVGGHVADSRLPDRDGAGASDPPAWALGRGADGPEQAFLDDREEGSPPVASSGRPPPGPARPGDAVPGMAPTQPEALAEAPSPSVPEPSVAEGVGEDLKEDVSGVAERVPAHMPKAAEPRKAKPPRAVRSPKVKTPKVKTPKVKPPKPSPAPEDEDDAGVTPAKPSVAGVGTQLARALGLPPA